MFCESSKLLGEHGKKLSSFVSVNVQAPGEKEERNRKTGQVELLIPCIKLELSLFGGL